MEVSGHLHTPATLPTGNKPSTHRQEAEWSPEPVYMFGRTEKYLDVSINLCQSSQQSIIMNRDVFEFLYSCS
jgi:hypothetical protein